MFELYKDEDFMYESEFEIFFHKEFSRLYGIEEFGNIMSYNFAKYMLINNVKKIQDVYNDKNFYHFLIESLNIPIVKNGNYFIFKKTKFYLSNKFAQSIENIVDSFVHIQKDVRVVENEMGKSTNWATYINNLVSDIKEKAKKQSKKFKKAKEPQMIFIYFALLELHYIFDIHIFNYFKMHPEIDYYNEGMEFNEVERTIEEKSELHIEHYLYETDNIEIIPEKELEEFLKRNMNYVEDEIKFINQQVKIENGIIDILGRDKNNNDVIIEVKTKEDTRIIWQALYYPEQYEKEKGKGKKPRMIVYSNSFPKHILSVLEKINYIELIHYVPKIEKGQLVGLKTKKIKEST